jgi:hypothetical protein
VKVPGGGAGVGTTLGAAMYPSRVAMLRSASAVGRAVGMDVGCGVGIRGFLKRSIGSNPSLASAVPRFTGWCLATTSGAHRPTHSRNNRAAIARRMREKEAKQEEAERA